MTTLNQFCGRQGGNCQCTSVEECMTEAEGYAASLRQQADLMEKANAGKVSAYVAIDDFDVDELRNAADFIERVRAQRQPDLSRDRIEEIIGNINENDPAKFMQWSGDCWRTYYAGFDLTAFACRIVAEVTALTSPEAPAMDDNRLSDSLVTRLVRAWTVLSSTLIKRNGD